MPSLKTYKIALLTLAILISNVVNAQTICMTGKIVKSLPSYGQSFLNAASLAIERNKPKKKITIKVYFYDNRPLDPIYAYNAMIKDHCSAIIGFEYLSDLLLVTKVQRKNPIPIFTSYASTVNSDKIPPNVFMFMPSYNFLSNKMFEFLTSKFGKIDNILIITEVNRMEMLKTKAAYSELLSNRKIKFDTFDFLENDPDFGSKLDTFLKNKKFHFVILLSGAIASSDIADKMNNHKTVFIGTENFGSSSNESFYVRLKDKKIHAFFIRNLDFLKTTSSLAGFEAAYKKRFHNNPSILSAYTYDAINIILNTIKSSKSISVQNILSTKFNGITDITIKDGKFYRSNDYIILSSQSNGYVYEK